MTFSLSGLFTKIVPTKEEKKNFINETVRGCFSGLLPVFASVSIMQAFLLANGLTAKDIGLFNMVSNIAAIIGMLSVISAADKQTGRKLVITSTIFNIPTMIMPAIMLVLSFTAHNMTKSLLFILAAVAFAINALAQNVRGIFLAKVQRFLFHESSYGTAFGASGLILYLVAMLMGLTAKPILSTSHGYTILFLLALLTVIGALYFNNKNVCLDDVNRQPETVEDKPTPKQGFIPTLRLIFARSDLRWIMLMHVGRGAINAFVYCFMLIGAAYCHVQLSGAAYITLLIAIACILAYIIVTLFYNRLGTARIGVYSLLLCIVALLLLLISRNTVIFYAMVILVQLGYTVYGQAVPIGCYKIAPPEALGSFTVIRIVIMQGCEGLFTVLISSIIGKTSLWIITVLCIAAVLLNIVCWIGGFSKIPYERPFHPFKAFHLCKRQRTNPTGRSSH